MKTICVFLGSNQEVGDDYHEIAADVGQQIVDQDLTLIFGGCAWGTMRTLSKTVMDNGGSVTGIIEDDLYTLQDEELYCTELIVTPNVAERKMKMYEMADAFATLPGGIGTLDEYFSIYCENCLAKKPKPNGLLNLNGYYNPLLKMLESGFSEKFISEDRLKMLLVDNTFAGLLKKLRDAV